MWEYGRDYRKTEPLRMALLLIALAFCPSPAAFGQAGVNASIYGTVSDSSGAVIPGVKVTATNVGTNISWSNVSNADGYYVIPDLPIGQYRVEAAREGFDTFQATGLTLSVAQSARVDVLMRPGTTTQSVTVSGGAPMVDAESAAVKGTVERQFIDQLPLIDRDISALETIEAGTGNQTMAGQLTVNGDRGGHNEFQLNGLTVNNPQFTQLQFSDLPVATFPNPDAVQEFTLIRNGYEAQYGRNEGGQVIVVTRSGTNQFHGSAYDYLRNNALDARSFFAANKTPYRRNIFGGSLGGPIRKDKLFFFGAYQGTRQTASPNSGVQNIVPNQAQRNGDFSALTTPIIDPTTGQAFPGNIIPTGRLNSISQNLLSALVPLPNGPNGELIYSPTGSVSANQVVAKIDYMISSKDHLSGSLFYQNATTLTNSGLPKLFDALSLPYTVISVNESHSFSPTLLNDFTVGGLHYGYVEAPADVGGSPTMGTFGATYYIPPINKSIYVSVSGNVTVSDGVPSQRPSQFLQLQDNVHWIRGNHAFVFGGSVNQGRTWTTTGYIKAGQYLFNGYASGNSVADLMLGIPSQFNQNSGAYIPHFGQDYALYAQDTWRVRRDLTLNLGLRYAPTFPEKILNGENSNFIAGEQSMIFPTAPLGLVYTGDPGINDGYYYNPTWKVVEPRFGIAWTPYGHSTWVVRSGVGLFHGQPITFSVDNDLSPPYTLSSTVNAPPSMANPFINVGDPFPFHPVLPSAPPAERQAVTFFPGLVLGDFNSIDTRLPASWQWNLTVQHQLSRNNSIEVAYVGSHTYRVFFTNDPNPPTYIPGQCDGQPCSTEANINSRRPYGPALSTILLNQPIGTSSYNALQATYRHEVRYGLTVLANFTWEKTLTLSMQDFDQSTAIWNPVNYRANYGFADFDIPYKLNVSYAWMLPWFASDHGFGGALARGWTLAGIVGYAPVGLPLTIFSGVDNSVSGYGTDHADQVGTWQFPGGRSRGQQVQEWFNTQAFTVNALGTYGDTGRNIVRGPGFLTWDMSFFRDFPIGERLKLQYRLDASNIFNHTVLTGVNTTVTSSGYGIITGTGNPRILQMALRFVF